MTPIVLHRGPTPRPVPALGRNLSRLVLTLAALTVSTSPFAQDAPQSLPTIPLTAGMYNIKVEVARTPREHAIGLMWRESMPANDGMLFIFPDAGVQCFWMKNTLIPLAAAFLDDEGRIVNVAEMQPRSEASHCSARPVRFVLEMNKGWFTRKGLKPGDRLTGQPFQAPR